MNDSASPSPRPKRRWVKRLLIGGGVAIGLIVVLAIVAVALIPADKIQEIAFEQLEANTGLRGSATDASVSLFPLGARLEGLRIDDPSDASPVWEELEIELESAVVSASLMSILRGSPEVSEVRLVRPRVSVVLAEPAASDDGGGGAASGAGGGGGEVAAALGLLSIEDGAVTITQPTGQVIELQGLDNEASLRLASGVATGDVSGSLQKVVLRGGEMPRPIEVASIAWELDLEAQVDGSGGRVDIARVETSGVRANGTASWTGTAPELDVALDLTGDVATVWEELGRGFVDPATLPEGMTLDDFALVGGEMTADVTYQGVVPEGDPDDPMAAVRPLRVDGRLDGLRPRVFGRDDLVTLSSDFEVREATLIGTGVQLDGDALQGGGTFRVPLALDAPLTGEMGLELRTAPALDVAAALWPRLEPLMATGEGPPPAGPEEWPAVDGTIVADVAFDLPVDGSFDPATGAADAVTWTLTAPDALTVELPTFTESFVTRDLRVTGDLRTASVREGRVTGPGVEATARLDVSGFPERIVVRGDANASTLDLDALQAAVVEPETAMLVPRTWIDDVLGVGVAWAQSDASSSAEAVAPPPENLDVDVALTADTMQSTGYTLRDLQARAMLVEQKLTVDGMQASLGTGRMTGTAGVDWTAEQPAWTTDFEADAVPASTLLEPFAGRLASAVTTQFSGAIDLDGPLATEPEQILTALTGLADLRASDGMIAAEDLLGSRVSRFLGENAEQWRRLTFDALDANLQVREGKVWFDKLLIRGTTEVNAGGWVGLDGTTNVRLDVRLPAGMTPQLGALQPVADLLQDEQQRIAFGVNVTGPGKDPQVEIDLAELQERATERGRSAAEDAARDAVDDLIDRNRGGIEDALGDLLGGDAAGDSTAEGASEGGLGGLLDRLKGGKKKGGGG